MLNPLNSDTQGRSTVRQSEHNLRSLKAGATDTKGTRDDEGWEPDGDVRGAAKNMGPKPRDTNEARGEEEVKSRKENDPPARRTHSTPGEHVSTRCLRACALFSRFFCVIKYMSLPIDPFFLSYEPL